MSKARTLQRNYLRKALALAQTPPTKKGELRHIFVQHDDWCPALHGGNTCTCNPDVTMMSDEDYRRRASAKKN